MRAHQPRLQRRRGQLTRQVVRVSIRATLTIVVLALALLVAFLLWRGLTLECPVWDEEEGDAAVLARR